MILILIYLIYMILINILSFVLVVVVIVLDKGVVVFYFKKMFLNEIWMICYPQISTIY